MIKYEVTKRIEMSRWQEVKDLTQPLNEIGISLFHMLRVNEKEVCFSNRPDWHSFFVEKVLKGQYRSEDMIGRKDSRTSLLFDADFSGSGVLKDAYDFGIGNVMYYFTDEDDHTDCFCFGLDSKIKSYSPLLNNLGYLKTFARFFQESMKENFKKSQLKPLIPKNTRLGNQSSSKHLNLELTPFRYLSKKELEILSLTLGGWSAKSISCQMKISSRTVEKHKENIVSKTNLDSMRHVFSELCSYGLTENMFKIKNSQT